MKPLSTLFIVLFLVPLVSAFPCDQINDISYCKEIVDLNLTVTERDNLYSALLYDQHTIPNHTFVKNYNLGIEVTSPPDNTTLHSSDFIKDAWLRFLSVFPSVYENSTLYVNENIEAVSAFDYLIELPPDYKSQRHPETRQGDCKRQYTLVSEEQQLNYYDDGILKGQNKHSFFSIEQDGPIEARLTIKATVQVRHYQWKLHKKGKRRYHRCEYHHTDTITDTLKISDTITVSVYTKEPSISLYVHDEYFDTLKGSFVGADFSLLKLIFNNASLLHQKYWYDVVFSHKPYYFATFRTHPVSRITPYNLFFSNGSYFVKSFDTCDVWALDYFDEYMLPCNFITDQDIVEPLVIPEKDIDIDLLIKIIFFLVFLAFFYMLGKAQFGKLNLLFILLILVLPFVAAEEQEKCGITNLASCIPEKIYNFLLVIINITIIPLLAGIKSLLLADVQIDLFYHVWSVIRYLLSFFYLFIFVYAGYIYLFSGSSPMKRAQAKDMVQNTLIMIVLVQASFYLYGLILDLSIALNSTFVGFIDPHFFLLTADNIVNIGLQFVFGGVYMLVLLGTLLLLVIRYIVVCFGVVILPFGLFCMVVPPLKSFGQFIMEVLGWFIFITFIDLLIIFVCSLIIQVSLFENFKILVMIACFSIVNYTLWLTIKLVLHRSANFSVKESIKQTAKYLALAL